MKKRNFVATDVRRWTRPGPRMRSIGRRLGRGGAEILRRHGRAQRAVANLLTPETSPE